MSSHGANRTQGHLFLSYANSDRHTAVALAADLESREIPIWIDRTGIAGGTAWAEEIVGAIRSATAVVVLCSPASMESRNVRQELQLAWDENRPIVPLLLEPVNFPDSIAFFVKGRQWIELFDLPASEWAARIVDSAKQVGLSQSVPSQPESSPLSRISLLPALITPLIGREADLDQIVSLLSTDNSRLITLTGPGGVGKTRLALEALRRVADRFDDNVYFIDLAPVRDSDQVASSISRAIGVREYGDRPARERLLDELGDTIRLLVLDNFEQVVDAAPLLPELLSAAPQLHILVTSRESLRVRGEVVVAIRPFERFDEQVSQANPAIELFVATAQSVKPGFALSEQNVATIAEICHRLDGLPLPSNLRPPGSSTFRLICCCPGWSDDCPCSPAASAIHPQGTKHCVTRLPGATISSNLPSNNSFAPSASSRAALHSMRSRPLRSPLRRRSTS